MVTNKELDLSWVNSIKGISIIGVFLTHTYTQLPVIVNSYSLSAFAANGRLGAHIFYLISGFLLCVSYYKGNTETKVKFLLRKLTRLMPLAWLISFLKYVLVGGYSNKAAVVASLVFADVLNPKWWGYIHNGWISVLAFLYLLFVFIVDKINSLKRAAAFSIIAWYGSIIGWRLLMLTGNDVLGNWGGYILLGLRNLSFGILLYYILISYQIELKQKSKYIANIFLMIAVMYIITHIVFDSVAYKENFYGEFALAVMMVILSQVISQNKLLVNTFWDFLGKYSYGIFLLHLTLPSCFPMLAFPNPYLNVLMLFGLSVAGAYAFYHIVEKPLLRYIDKKIFKRILEK